MIGIVDYGLGNIRAFSNIYKRLGIPHFFAKDADSLRKATHIILPGVGSFDYAMKKLANSGMKDVLDELVLEQKRPVLGICVGMQIMAESSEEGNSEGLGWLDTKVVKFSQVNSQYPLPHMGWNDIEVVKNNQIFDGLDAYPAFYFLHSYHFKSDYEHCIATAKYSNRVGCIIQKDNIYGIQCHPEKSHHNGVAFLKNFYGVGNA